MPHMISRLDAVFRIGRLAGAAAILAGVSLCFAGCHGFHTDPGRYQFDPAAEWGQQARPDARSTEFWGVSNEARQIERRVGVQ